MQSVLQTAVPLSPLHKSPSFCKMAAYDGCVGGAVYSRSKVAQWQKRGRTNPHWAGRGLP